ncbi:WAT1-related protein At5g07050-like [Vicia villosa]|uniref:WAT1-related protein At5g07050-like n=1 Tax=Vicia villosa TaxID=3911 RepID=UPI00273AD052|nr:WAT1-related protein At5g07050-like [Vicia villosa]
MEGDKCCSSSFQRCKPYIAMICLQFGFAGMNIITKVSLNRGMSHYVLVVYRHAFATAAIAPFAIVLERKIRPRITFLMFIQMFVLGLLGLVIQNLYYAGLKFTSPTYSCAISNILPAITFVMAVIFRMEKLDIKKLRCQVKVIGTVITVAGAMVMTLYKGQVIQILSAQYMHHPRNYVPENNTDSGEKDWVKGSIFLIIATFAWSCFFILQAVTLRKFSAPLSLAAIVCFLGTLQSIAVTYVMESNPNVWNIGWDINLLAAAYAGIISSGLTYYVQGIVMQKKGPVFVTAFSPLMMIIVAIMGTFILAEKLYLGGVIGAILIVIGLYSVLWGKNKEIEAETIKEGTKCCVEKGVLETVIEGVEINDIEVQKDEPTKVLRVTIVSAPKV